MFVHLPGHPQPKQISSEKTSEYGQILLVIKVQQFKSWCVEPYRLERWELSPTPIIIVWGEVFVCGESIFRIWPVLLPTVFIA